MKVRIKFIAFGSSTAFGSFGPDDVLACAPEMARHLVDDIKVAQYLDGPPAVAAEAPPADAAKTDKPRRQRGAAPKEE